MTVATDKLKSISIRLIDFGSTEYDNELVLREQVLRLPIGFTLSPSDTEHDSTDTHICAFASGSDNGGLGGVSGLIGCCLMREIDSTQVKMRQVAVDPSAQGAGLGTLLIGEFEKLARSRGYREVVLDARESAISFYLRLGYVITSELFTQVSVPHRKMKKTLS